MLFLGQGISLDWLHHTATRITKDNNQHNIKVLQSKIIVDEFNVMMILVRGWSLAQIAGASQKSEEATGAYKSNTVRKLGKNNTRLKYTTSHYNQP